MATSKKTIKGFDQLLASYLESKKLYSFLADQESDVQLIRFYNLQSTQRNRFANDIKGIIRSLGERPKKSIIKPKLWYNWNQMIDELVSTQQESFLQKVIKKDQQAIQLCQEFLNDDSLSEEETQLLSMHVKLLNEADEFFFAAIAERTTVSTMEAIS